MESNPGLVVSMYDLELTNLLCMPHLRRTKDYLNKKVNGNVRDLLTPTTYIYIYISQMTTRFDFDSKLLQRTIRQVTFAHPCIAIDSCKK